MKNKELFFPYYINQGRLLDLYAILNGGYSEYEELVEESSKSKSTNGKINANASMGFKLFKISSEASANSQSEKSNSNASTIKKVQTVTSILSIVVDDMNEKKYIKDINEAKSGSFVSLPVCFQINSAKNIIDEMIDLMKLASDISKLGVNTGIKNSDLKSFENIAKSLKSFVNSEEVIWETDEYAIVGSISDAHYYQGSKSDIINTNLKCLAQVKRVFDNGTELMRDNKLGMFKDAKIKNELIDAINSVANNDTFKFTSTAVSEIKGKPVYEIEIIALYQTELVII